MKKINFKILILTSIVCLLPIILGVHFYNELPEQVAIHFNINNEPDNYFPKAGFVFGMPFMMVAIQIFVCIVSDLSDKNPEANKKAVSIFKWIIPSVTVILYIVTLMIALGNTIDIRKIAMMILGMMFIVLGNYTPKTKGIINGMKHLEDKEYKKMARILGYTFIANGLLCFISILFNQYVSICVIALVILEAIIFYCTWGCKKTNKNI